MLQKGNSFFLFSGFILFVNFFIMESKNKGLGISNLLKYESENKVIKEEVYSTKIKSESLLSKNNVLSLEHIDNSNLSLNFFEEISSIERDAWSSERWLWEYLKCNSCGKTYSKQDVYWKWNYLKLDELESLNSISFDNLPNCSDCNWETSFMYPFWHYVEKVINKFNNSEKSYITVLKDRDWIIRWLSEWHVYNFDMWFPMFYDKQLSEYHPYCKDLIDDTRNLIMDNLNLEKEFSKIFVWSSILIEEPFRSSKNFYKLAHGFFNSLDDQHLDILWFWETRESTPAYLFFSSVDWTFHLWSDIILRNYIDSNDYLEKIRLFFHPYWPKKCRDILNLGYGSFLKRLMNSNKNKKLNLT